MASKNGEQLGDRTHLVVSLYYGTGLWKGNQKRWDKLIDYTSLVVQDGRRVKVFVTYVVQR